jgi:hypothetical protein
MTASEDMVFVFVLLGTVFFITLYFIRTVVTRKIVAFQLTVASALYYLNSLEIFMSPRTLTQEKKWPGALSSWKIGILLIASGR